MFIHYLIYLTLLLSSITKVFSQDDNYNYKEQKKFLHFVQNNVLKANENTRIRKILNNKNKFLGTVLYGKASHYGLLTDDEIENAIKQMHGDTTVYILSPKVIKHITLVGMTDSADYEFSKPVFIRDYKFCIFSFNSLVPDTQTTNLYKKECGKWVFVKTIGNILNY